MKKKVLKIVLLAAFAAILVATMFACAAKDTTVDVYKGATAEDNMLKSADSTLFSLGANVSGVSIVDGLASFDYTVDVDWFCGKIVNLETKATVLEAHKDTIYVDVKGADSNKKSYNQILVARTIDAVSQLAIYNKAGQQILGFSKENYDNRSTFRTLSGNIFYFNGSVYDGALTGNKKIIDGNFASGTFTIFNEDRIVYTDSGYRSYYDFSGKLIYTAVTPTDVTFYALSSNKGLYVTVFNELPIDASDYTYANGVQKIRINYELVDFATGNKTAVPFNYVISGLSIVPNTAGDADSAYTSAAKGFIRVTGTEIQGRLLSKTSSVVFVDTNLNIKKVYDNVTETAISATRKIVRQGSTTAYALVDENGNVLRSFGSSASYNAFTGLISSTVNSRTNYYNTDGGLVINGSDYNSSPSFSVNNGKFAYVTKTVDTVTVHGVVNTAGNFTEVFKSDSATHLFEDLGSGLYGIREVAATEWTVKNYAGTALFNLKTTDTLNLTRSTDGKTAYQIVVEEGITKIRTLKTA